MKIQVWSLGTTSIDLDPQYQVPAICAAIETGAEVGSAIIDYTDSERSDISYDQYAIVTEDDGTLRWHGWLSAYISDDPPAEAKAVLEALHRLAGS